VLVRSEYSFRQVFGHMKEVVAALPSWGGIIADSGVWSHVHFATECAKQGKKAVLGCRFPRAAGGPVIVVPRTPAGLRALYGAVARGLPPLPEEVPGGLYLVVQGRPGPGELQGYFPGVNAPGPGCSVASSDNLFPAPGDRQAWLLMLGRLARQRAGPGHIMTEPELIAEGADAAWIRRLRGMMEECDTPLPRAENVKYPVADAQRELAAVCWAELHRRGLGEAYAERLKYELELIAQKCFADYFLVIWDMIHYAKTQMLVGPARGSSAGSLVCWLTRITEIDPLRHALLFERFMDINRMDLPDIDIDFPDEKRHLVVEYLRTKYGEQNVAHIGTIIRYKPKSALTDVAKQAKIPLWELDKLKDVMIERSSGDSRTSQCLEDSLTGMDVGRALMEKYPVIRVACRLEDHARSAGMHAAGLIVCNEPVRNFCGVTEEGCAQLDKKSAEKLNMLKIDALGLRTLSIIEETCQLIGKPREDMYNLPLDDAETFVTLNARRFSGIFQYEGIALQSVAKQITIDCFEDVAAITALARPGPLSGGETTRWIIGKNAGRGDPLHPALEPYTRDTFGTVLYQEQVMQMTRNIGKFSWADTAKIRKLMSDRKGNEAFGKFEDQFLTGAQENGIALGEARKIWKAIDSMGSWTFNRSHSVAYGLLSYWTAWLKTHHPVEFAVANLRHAKDTETALQMIRELHREATPIEFTACDAERSTHRWEFDGRRLLGPLTGLPGIGTKTALDIQMRRTNGIALTVRQKRLLAGASVFADHSPARRLWGDWYAHPGDHFDRVQRVWEIDEMEAVDRIQEFVVIGKLIKKNLRDLNEEKYLVRRGGRVVPDDRRLMLLFHLEDDTGRLLCCINARNYKKLGQAMVEKAGLGAWFAVKGRIPTEFKMLMVENVKWLI
jgi:DNA polymerase III alpha subunit